MATGSETTSTGSTGEPTPRPTTPKRKRGRASGGGTAREGATASTRQGTARPATTRNRGAAARPATGGRGERDEVDERYDLLTAALIGAAVGATAMLLVRRPAVRKAARPLAGIAAGEIGRMALKAGAGAVGARAMRDAARVAAPAVRDAAGQLGEYVQTARSAIDDFLAAEVRDLRKAIRRGRQRAGL